MRVVEVLSLAATLAATDAGILQKFLQWRTDYLREHFPIGTTEALLKRHEELEREPFVPVSSNELLPDFGIFGLNYKDQQEQEFELEYKVKFPSLLISWPQKMGVVNVRYAFGDDKISRTAVEAGIAHWKEHTCLTFTEVDPKAFKPHIVFYESAQYCSSLIGRKLFPIIGQPIMLAKGCQLNLGTIIHEIGHALGFVHEQSRTDRDKHVVINWTNIQFRLWGNFVKVLTEKYGVPYDYYSVMHYGTNSFTKNGKSTVLALNPSAQGLVGLNRERLSHMDKRMANIQYKCIDKWVTKCGLTRDPCLSLGYLGKDCNCVCPEGTKDSLCETRTSSDYTAAMMAKYLPDNSVVTSEGTVSTPGYPARPNVNGVRYTTRIVAPKCYKVQLTFTAFSLQERCNDKTCCFDGMEVRTDGNDVRSGTWYCGAELRPSSVLTSASNRMDIYYKGLNYAKYGLAEAQSEGYQATVKFVTNPGC